MHTQNVERLVADLERTVSQRPADDQFWLGIAGAPGSGKSTLATALHDQLNVASVVLPMDGYHLYRHQLDALPDSQTAHQRRGAPFTFDAVRFVRDLQSAKQSQTGAFPSFDHGTGDPVEDAIVLNPSIRVVLVEGNYLLLDKDPWRKLKESVFDESWFLDVPLAICAQRVEARHIRTGESPQQARERVLNNDLPNGRLICESSPQRSDRILRFDSTGQAAF
jgi:pantothenate kinase